MKPLARLLEGARLERKGIWAHVQSWTWATSLYFPDTRAKPSHCIFPCAETQSDPGWHLGYGNRLGDVGRDI